MFSCLARPDSFSAVPRASGRSRFQVLLAGTPFRRYRGRRVPFSCFALPDSFSAVTRVSGPVFMFSALGLVFGGTEGVGPVSFSSFARRDTFSAVLRASGPVFMFCAPGLVFGRYRGCRVPFSCFALADSFLVVPRATSTPLGSRTLFRQHRGASGPVFMFCSPGLVFGGTEVVWSRFHVLRARTRFRRFRGRRVPFSCFELPDSFSAVPRASCPVFMFCAPGLVLGGIEGVGSRFHVLRARTHYRRNRGRLLPFSCFALPESFSAVPRASGLVFKFCAPGIVFGGT
jgi:hypothetical protein